jgi:hypothetical protein
MQVTLRGLSPEAHTELKARAKARHQSLNAYILTILEREVEGRGGGIDTVLDRIRASPKYNVTTDEIVAAIREVRGEP